MLLPKRKKPNIKIRNEKETLEKVQEIGINLRCRLQNKNLLEEIMDKLYSAAKKGNIHEITDNEVTTIDFQTGDTFSLSITDDSITWEWTCWNGHHQERKKVTFDKEKITLTTIETTNYVKGNTNKPCGSEKKSTIEVYENNELTYKREFESKTETDITDTTSQTYICETYINQERQAVQKQIATGDESAFHPTGIRYAKTSHIEVPPFNTIEKNPGVYMYGMSTATQEEYETFIKTWTEKNNTILKKQ